MSSFSPINSFDQSKRQAFKKRLQHPKRILLLLGFIVLVTIVVLLAIRLFSTRDQAGTSNQVRSVLSTEELKQYNSPENKFSILFPGYPAIDKTQNTSGDKQIPITTYNRSINNGAKTYTVAVYDYRALQLDPDRALESALNTSLQNTQGAKVDSTQKGTYAGNKSIEAEYTIIDKDKTYPSHIRYVFKDNIMYSMILIGDNKDAFNTFANSLRLN